VAHIFCLPAGVGRVPLKECVDIPHTMQYPDNINAAANRHIKNQVHADLETLQTEM